jgi:hypothetical protein
MRTMTRWLTVGASALVLVGGALTVAAATEGSREVPGGPGQEHRYGEMRGDVDRIEDRDRLRLHDGSCLEDAVPAGEAVQERSHERERAGERHQGCACLPSGGSNRFGEANRNGDTEGPQQEQERNGAGPNGSPSGDQIQEQTQIQEQQQEQEQTQSQEQGGNTAGSSGSDGRGGA